MIGWSEPTQGSERTWTGSVYAMNGSRGTTSAYDFDRQFAYSTPYVIVIESRSVANEYLPNWSDVLGNESIPQRRRRLSLEAIKRLAIVARRAPRLRVRSRWRRRVHVARTCALSERWRVLAS